METCGLYIYGIINSEPGKIINNYSTKDGDKICCIPYKDISAVVSDSKKIDYSYLPKDILARRLIKHQIVIEEIMNLGNTIIPMKLGTLLNNENEVRNILDKGYSLFKDIFEKINGKIEIDLAVTWNDLTTMLKEIGEDKVIKDLKESILADSQGITVENKIKIGVLIKNELDQIREIISSDILTCFRDCCDDIKIHALMDDTMIVNSALLISKTKQKDFEGRVNKLNSNFSEKLNFRCVGPLPPYSFYTLEIKKLQHEDLNWAMKKFGLKDSLISKDEIKKAYRRLSFSSHPDQKLNVRDIKKEFDEVNKAYKILNNYCHSCEQANHGENNSFNLEEFDKPALIVKVKD